MLWAETNEKMRRDDKKAPPVVSGASLMGKIK
jgi:hypothetical protein